MWSWSLLSFAIYHRKLIQIFSLSLTIDNIVCGSMCGSSSSWIVFYYLIWFPRNPCGSHSLPCLYENVFDSNQIYLDGRQTFSFGTLCHCEKCIEFGLFVWTLLFLGVLYLIPSYMFYLLEWDKSLSMCGFIHPLCSIVFSSLVELCWIDPLLILFFDIFWTSNVFWQTFYSFLNLLMFCPKYVFLGSWKYCACMFTKCISYTILCFVWSII